MALVPLSTFAEQFFQSMTTQQEEELRQAIAKNQKLQVALHNLDQQLAQLKIDSASVKKTLDSHTKSK